MSYLANLFTRPARAIALSFAVAIGIGTALLSLPISTAEGVRAPFVDALFTATSAVCVTGLTTVDTGTYWSPMGKAIIALLIQIGGLGIMTLATLIAVVFFRRIGLRTRISAQAETKTMSAYEFKGILKRIITLTILVEVILATLLITRFTTAYDMPFSEGVTSGVFHAISAFNNAGFGLYSDSLMGFATDPWILLSIAGAVVIGGLGFPVIIELKSHWRHPASWSALSRVTVAMTLFLLFIGTLGFLVAESDNDRTWGGMGAGDQLLNSFFASVMPRTAGFNSVNVASMQPESIALTEVLMFIGGGSAGTAGGIKITTVGILLFAVWAELRGRPDVEIGLKRINSDTQRQALSVVMLGFIILIIGTTLLVITTPHPFSQVIFEAISAFGTVGLSLGITAELPDTAKYILIALMFAGRIGPLTFASALAMRSTTRLHRRPEERMSIG